MSWGVSRVATGGWAAEAPFYRGCVRNVTSGSPVGTVTERGLRILVADENEEALETLAAVLEGLGHVVTPFAVSVREATEVIAREDPNLAIVAVHQDDEHALALIGETVEYASGPVIAQVPRGDTQFVARAAERGISAWVESNDPNSVQAAIEVAIRRYREARSLAEKVEQLETALQRRTRIERAKGILMERHGVDDRGAFELMREQARSTSRPVVEVAQAVLDGHALLPPRPRR
jgi:AmiR/NasT family two-component response regulator